jgi:lipoprotein Spr
MRFLMMFFYFTSLLAAPAFSAALPPSWHYHDAAPGFSSRFHMSTPQHPRLKHALLSRYAGWKGTRYHLGGTTHRGVDCSALMQHLFAESASSFTAAHDLAAAQKGQSGKKNGAATGGSGVFQHRPATAPCGGLYR